MLPHGKIIMPYVRTSKKQLMIWQQYMQGQTEKGIAALLQQTYGIDDQEAYQDVQQFIRQLREQGII